MNTKLKRRMIAASGIIIVVLVLLLAFVGGNTAAQAVSVSQVASSDAYLGQKVQVSGNVVADSFSTKDNVLTFSIYDPEDDPESQLLVHYEGAASSTFGNDVTAICTGRIDDSGALIASEMVTKCPSKYENATDALTIAQLLDYGESVYDKPVKVSGTVEEGSLAAAGQGQRMVLLDPETGEKLPILYDGALSDEIVDGSSLVLTGSIDESGSFTATDVALEA